MKKNFNVLIIEDENDIAEAIIISLSTILPGLNIEVEYYCAEDERETEIMLGSEKFDLISLDGILRNRFHASPLIEKIVKSGAVVFSLSAGAKPTEEAKENGLNLSFVKNYEGIDGGKIIFPADLEKIKKEIESKIKYQVDSFSLTDSVTIFSENYADSTLSEKHAKDHCDLVVKELAKNHIYFAAVDGDFFFKILISSADYRFIIQDVIKKSGLEYWKVWFDKFFSLKM